MSYEILNEKRVAYTRINDDLWWVQLVTDVETGIFIHQPGHFNHSLGDLLMYKYYFIKNLKPNKRKRNG
jgi:hypothetical protein